MTAESKLKEIESHEGGAVALDLSTRVATLERENERLQNRLDEATGRAKQMLERVLSPRKPRGVSGDGKKTTTRAPILERGVRGSTDMSPEHAHEVANWVTTWTPSFAGFWRAAPWSNRTAPWCWGGPK